MYMFRAAAVAATLLIGAFVHESRSCSCLPPPPVAQAVAAADAVFLGKVVSFELASSQTERIAQFEIIKVWKGRPAEVSKVLTPENEAACGYDFQIGETYLVYAYKSDSGNLHTHLCTRTWRASGAENDLKYLASFVMFPLTIGNAWQYTSPFGAKIGEAIRDTMRVGHERYYHFDQFREFKNPLLRLSDEGKLYLLSDQPEQVWVDFNANEKESWHVVGPLAMAEWDVQLVSKTDTVKTATGTYFPCLRFHFKFNGADNDWDEWYYPNVGVVRRDLHGIALFQYPLTSVVLNQATGVQERPTGAAPHNFTLAQNYPNPLAAHSQPQATTLIRFTLHEAAETSLTIFNALGQQVRVLFTGARAAGEYQVLWNGSDTVGQHVPAGVYFYRLQVGRATEMKKMIVLE